MVPFTQYSFRVVIFDINGKLISSNTTELNCATGYPPSRQPNQFSVLISSETVIQVSWEPLPLSEVTGKLFEYVVKWKILHEKLSKWKEQRTGTWNTSSLIVDVREPYREHIFEIYSQNEFGRCSLPHSSLKVFAGTSSPLKGPENYQISSITRSGAVDLCWEPIPEEIMRGPISGYTVVIHQKSKFGRTFLTRRINTSSNNHNIVVNDLVPFCLFQSFVFGLSDIYGQTTTSNIVEFRTPPQFIGPVMSLKLMKMGFYAIYLYWESPSPITAQMTSYVVQYRMEMSRTIHKLIVPLEFPHVKIPKLEYGKVYVFTVFTNTTMGFGKKIQLCGHVGFDKNYDLFPLAKPAFTWAFRENILTIYWFPNDRKNVSEVILGSAFFVQYKEASQRFYQNTSLENERLYIELKHLNHNMTYTIRVVSQFRTQKQFSISSNVTLFTNLRHSNRNNYFNCIFVGVYLFVSIVLFTCILCFMSIIFNLTRVSTDEVRNDNIGDNFEEELGESSHYRARGCNLPMTTSQ